MPLSRRTRYEVTGDAMRLGRPAATAAVDAVVASRVIPWSEIEWRRLL
jgi:hypothetical protein